MDENMNGPAPNPSRKPRPPRRVMQAAAVVVLSAVIGSASTLVLAWAMVPTLFVSRSGQSSVGLQSTSYLGSSGHSGGTVNKTVNISMNNAVVQVAKKVTPSVVGVLNYQYQPNGNGINTLQEYGVGSGIVFSSDGYIVTNNHVVAGAAKVVVALYGGRRVTARVVGTDPYTDLAVLKIPPSDIGRQNVAQFGNSDTLQAGDPVVAIGNPGGLTFQDTVTSGVISATSRVMPVISAQSGQQIGQEAVLQTDAAINPGNSGGPLCNAVGQVIGIDSSKIVATGFTGMGFAIPINEVKVIASQIIATGHATHPAIGIEAESLSNFAAGSGPNVPVSNGVYVVAVTSAAARAAGLQKGDVIVSLNGKLVTGLSSLQMQLWNSYKPGDVVTLGVYRGHTKQSITLKLTTLPPYHPASASGSSGTP